MKLLGRYPPCRQEGDVRLIPEEGEDLWHVYNLIRHEDLVTATTFRKVEVGMNAERERVKIKLQVKVEAVDFDPEGQEIRLKGRNLTDTEHVKLGAFHTLELELHRAFTLHKELWDSLDLDRLRLACNPSLSADLAVCLLTEGLGNVFLVGASTVLKKGQVQVNLPKKRGAAAAGFDKALAGFHDKLMQAVVKAVDWDIVKCLVIAGPGFAKDTFKAYLDAEAVRQDLRSLILNKPKIVVAQATSAYQHSLREVFDNPGIAGQIKDTKAAEEIAALKAWYAMLAQDSARAFYGPGHVQAAHELGAIQTLLLSDTLFRIADVAKRKRWVTLVEEVQKGGGTCVIFSGAHVAGEQLTQLTGVAAILRFPLPDLEDQELTGEL